MALSILFSRAYADINPMLVILVRRDFNAWALHPSIVTEVIKFQMLICLVESASSRVSELTALRGICLWGLLFFIKGVNDVKTASAFTNFC